MKRLLLVVLLLAGCSTPARNGTEAKPNEGAVITVWHDDARHVTCWLTNSGWRGISCLPDAQVHP